MTDQVDPIVATGSATRTIEETIIVDQVSSNLPEDLAPRGGE